MAPSRDAQIFIKLFENRFFQTDGSYQTPRTFDLEDRLGDLLVRAVKVTPITATRQATPDLRWNVRLISGWDRDMELAPVSLVTNNISATVPTRHPAFTDVAYFLPHARLQVLTVNNASITTLQSGFLSAGLLIDYWGV